MGFHQSHDFVNKYCNGAIVDTVPPGGTLYVDLLLFVMQAIHSIKGIVDENWDATEPADKIHSKIDQFRRQLGCSSVVCFVDGDDRNALKCNRARGSVVVDEVGTKMVISPIKNKLIASFREKCHETVTFVQVSGESEVAMVKEADEKTILLSDDSDILHLCIGREAAAILRLCPERQCRLLYDPLQLRCVTNGTPALDRFLILLRGTDFLPTVLSVKRFDMVVDRLNRNVTEREDACTLVDSLQTWEDMQRLLLIILSYCRGKPRAVSSVYSGLRNDCVMLLKLMLWQYMYSMTLEPPSTIGLQKFDDLRFPMVKFYATLLSF